MFVAVGAYWVITAPYRERKSPPKFSLRTSEFASERLAAIWGVMIRAMRAILHLGRNSIERLTSAKDYQENDLKF
jgi:hypothetical protein